MRSSETHPRCRHFPGRQIGIDAGLCQIAVRIGKGVGIKAVSMYEIPDHRRVGMNNAKVA